MLREFETRPFLFITRNVLSVELPVDGVKAKKRQLQWNHFPEINYG